MFGLCNAEKSEKGLLSTFAQLYALLFFDAQNAALTVQCYLQYFLNSIIAVFPFKGAWETNDPNDNWLHWQIVFPDLALVNKVAIQGGCREPRDPVCCAADR